MRTVSNEITGALSTFSPPVNMILGIRGVPFTTTPSIQVVGTSGSAKIDYTVIKPASTKLGKPTSLTVRIVRGGVETDGWRVKSMILVQIRRTGKETLATTWLEGVAEYGVARDEIEAVRDLIKSLGEYRESLESRENKLGDSAKRELDYLRKLVERLA